MHCSVPILLITWKRPDTTILVLEAIRKVRPTALFVASDGPRLGVNGELERVIATRELVMQSIDWSCEIKTRFSEVNLGCRDGVSSAITWFFENVAEGIILEDDVVPHPQFFEYCQLCLEKYQADSRIWAISGNQTSRDHRIVAKYPSSPLHLRYNFNCWGWASWRDRWKHYTPIIDRDWIRLNEVNVHSFSGIASGAEILKRARLASLKEVDSWANQVNAIATSRLQYTVHPAIALIKNIGFGRNATNTLDDLDANYFYEVNDKIREEWIMSVRQILQRPSYLPPFIREVSDLAYARPHLVQRLKRLFKKMLKLYSNF